MNVDGSKPKGIFSENQSIGDALKEREEKQRANSTASAAMEGTFLGVIVPCAQNIMGVILFLRLPWIVGIAGVWQTFIAVLVGCITTFLTTLSLAAVATNGKVKAGGSYFLISRSLGPSIGTSVGLLFFVANAVGAALYIIGMVEAYEVAAPNGQILELGSDNNIRVTGVIILSVSTLLVWIGIKYVARLTVLFLGVVCVMIMSMALGTIIGPVSWTVWTESFSSIRQDVELSKEFEGTLLDDAWLQSEGFPGFNADTFENNWNPSYSTPQHAFKDGVSTIFAVIALWFPGCTGIMAGSNRSVDLKNPGRSIPIGTLVAQLTTTAMYLLFVVLYGGAADRSVLANDKFFASTSCWPSRYIVIYGVIVSAFGAGLQSLTSATRLLSAIAEDKLLTPFLDPFVARPGKEPFLALMAAFVLCLVAIMLGEINAIAPLITMCFLLCYLSVNMSTCLLSLLGSPDWRPTFKFYHSVLSGLGSCICIFLMFVINWWVALVALGLAFLIMMYAASKAKGRRGLVCINYEFLSAKKALARLSASHFCIMIVGGGTDQISDGDSSLIQVSSQVCGKEGVVMFTDIAAGDISKQEIASRKGAVSEALQACSIATAFPYVVSSDNYMEALKVVLQTAGVGNLSPNIFMARLPEGEGEPSWGRFMDFINLTKVNSKSTVLVKGSPPSLTDVESRDKERFLDIWWTVNDGGLVVMLAYLMKRVPLYANFRVRLFNIAADDALSAEELLELQKNIEDVLADNRLRSFINEVHVIRSPLAGSEMGEFDHSGVAMTINEMFLRTLTRKSSLDSHAFTFGGDSLAPPKATAALDSISWGEVAGDASAKNVSIERKGTQDFGIPALQVGGLKRVEELSGFQRTLHRDLLQKNPRLVMKDEQFEKEEVLQCNAFIKALNGMILSKSQEASLLITNLFDLPTADKPQFKLFLDTFSTDFPFSLLVRACESDVEVHMA